MTLECVLLLYLHHTRCNCHGASPAAIRRELPSPSRVRTFPLGLALHTWGRQPSANSRERQERSLWATLKGKNAEQEKQAKEQSKIAVAFQHNRLATQKGTFRASPKTEPNFCGELHVERERTEKLGCAAPADDQPYPNSLLSVADSFPFFLHVFPASLSPIERRDQQQRSKEAPKLDFLFCPFITSLSPFDFV